MSPEKVQFTQHAMQRALERKLWKFIDKKKFFFDAEHIGPDKARLQDCLYVYKWEADTIKILTVYMV